MTIASLIKKINPANIFIDFFLSHCELLCERYIKKKHTLLPIAIQRKGNANVSMKRAGDI